MKRMMCALAALLPLACSAPPTAPSPTAVGGQAAADLSRPIGMQSVTLAFYGQNEKGNPTGPLIGLPVSVVAYPSGVAFALQTDKLGLASFKTTIDDSSIWMATPKRDGYCGTDHNMKLATDTKVGAPMAHSLARCAR